MSKLDMVQQQKDPLMGPQPLIGPPSYDQATGTVPTVYPTMPTVQPTMPAVYPTMPTVYPTVQTVQPNMPTVQTRMPAPMEKEGVMTTCSQCHNQVVSSVSSSYNGSAIAWIVYSICCCWPFAFFVMCMDHFKTWKHTCPYCRKLLAEYTPEASSGTICGLVCAVIVSLILVVLIVIGNLL